MDKKVITGPVTTEWVPQLNINWLVRNGYIKEGKKLEGNYQARKGDPELIIISDLTTENRVVKIIYKSLVNSKVIEDNIKIAVVPSNLGFKGKFNLYFCDVAGRKCKILYYDYWNQLYVHRKAYPIRIYYPLEICSKDERAFERHYIVRKKLLRKLLEYKNYSYGGDMTTIHKKIGKLMSQDKAMSLLIDEREERLLEKFDRKFN